MKRYLEPIAVADFAGTAAAFRRGCRWLAAMAAVLSLSGCVTARPPYIADTKVLPSAQFSAPTPPQVLVRPATSEEVENLMDFPGRKKLETAARLDSFGSILLAPVLFLFFWPEFLNPKHWNFRDDPKMQEALDQFPARLAKAIEQRFTVSPSGTSPELLEVAYYAAVPVIGPAADRVSFIFHAQITLQSAGVVRYREIIRIDPRAFNQDIPPPDATKSPERILNCADEVIPGMIQARFPGLPWKVHP